MEIFLMLVEFAPSVLLAHSCALIFNPKLVPIILLFKLPRIPLVALVVLVA
jgi:hypothetical protein